MKPKFEIINHGADHEQKLSWSTKLDALSPAYIKREVKRMFWEN